MSEFHAERESLERSELLTGSIGRRYVVCRCQRSAVRILTCRSAAGGGETVHCLRPAAVVSLVSSGTGHVPMSTSGSPTVPLLTALMRIPPAPVCY